MTPELSRRSLLAVVAAAPLVAAGPLAAFHAALRDLQAGRRSRVAVLQLGDSHTANDAFSGRLRELMQKRFGDAGRGFLPPGIPYRYYRPSQVTVAAQGWQPAESGPFGLALVRQRAEPGAQMTVRADQPGGAALVAVDAQGGGTVDMAFDTGQTAAVATSGGVWAEVPAKGAQAVTLTARGDGPLDLLGVSVATGRPGVTWSNLGAIGATVGITAQWEEALVAREMRALAPALAVLAFGANEGFKDSTDPAEYRALFRARLRALRRLAPAASVLVLLPPDGVRRGGSGCAAPGYGVPPMLGPVRRLQRDVAADEGAAVWDWSAAMGGACSILPLMRTDPPAAAPDGVHLLKPGYRATAEQLYAFLVAGLG